MVWEITDLTCMVHSASPGLSLDACGILLVASLSGTPLSSAALLRVDITEMLPPDFPLPSSGIFLPQRFDSVFFVAAILQVTSWAWTLPAMGKECLLLAHLPCTSAVTLSGMTQIVVASVERHLKAACLLCMLRLCLQDQS